MKTITILFFVALYTSSVLAGAEFDLYFQGHGIVPDGTK